MENFQEYFNYDFSPIEPMIIDNSAVDFHIPKMDFTENQNQPSSSNMAVTETVNNLHPPEFFQMNNQ